MVDDDGVAGLPVGINTALIVAAHPDDIESFAGGLVAQLTRAGCDVVYALATFGEGGCDDMSVPLPDVMVLRRNEQQAAADVLGVREVCWLAEAGGAQIADGEVVDTMELREAVVRVIRLFKPDMVVTFHPSTFFVDTYVNHVDHRNVGAATVAAVWPAAANPRFRPHLLDEGHQPHVVRELWLMLSDPAEHAVDIADVLDLKAAALAAHASQLPDGQAVADRVRRDAELAGVGGGPVLSERFHRVRINAFEPD